MALGDFTWGRPTDGELAAAHDALRGSELAGMAAPEAVERFLAVRDGGAPGAWQDSQRVLRDWMRANPEGERLAADTSASRDLRVQAASACADLKQPTTETVDTLSRIASGPRSGTPDDMLPSTATMSLGTIIDNAPGTPAAAKARNVLQQVLRGSDRAKTVEALHAASNSGDPAFTAIAVAKAGSAEADERAAAAHALRKMPPSQATRDALGTLLHDDVQPEVVKQVAEARREQMQTYGGQLSDRELALFATKLPGAPEGVRWEILRTLGHASRMQPAAQQVLVDWYREETASSLRMVIGQYVPASALRD